jgi:hypothetical protein
MAFAEALLGHRSLAAAVRRRSWHITGLMTTLGASVTRCPFIILDRHDTGGAVVVVELGVISWVRWKYMDTPPISAAFQVAFGGALVFAAGILIGSSG